jgi:integrase/recombinase XerD
MVQAITLWCNRSLINTINMSVQYMRLAFYARVHRSGKSSIICRIKIEGAGPYSDLATGISCMPDEWDNLRQQFTSAWRQDDNQRLLAIKQRLFQLYNAICLKGASINAQQLRCLYTNGHTDSIVYRFSSWITAFVNESMERVGKHITEGTFLTYEQRAAILLTYLSDTGQDHVLITEVKSFFWEQYNIHLREKKNYTPGVCKKHLQFLQMAFKHACRKGLLSNNPFHYMPLPSIPRSKPQYLRTAELQRIAAHSFATQRLQEVADLLLLSCYTGMSYTDLFLDIGKMIQEYKGQEWICYARSKSKVSAYVPLLPEAKALVSKYPQGLPLISNQKMNTYLKEIANIVGLNKRVSTRIGRNTFANMMLDKGFSAGAVAAMMGHTNERTTLFHYANYNLDKVAREFALVKQIRQ